MTPTSTQSEPLITRLQRKRREILFATILTLAAAAYIFVSPTIVSKKNVSASVAETQVDKATVATP